MYYKIFAIVLFLNANVALSVIDDSKEKVGQEQSSEKPPICKNFFESIKSRTIQKHLKQANQEPEQINKADCAERNRKQLMMLISMFLD